MQSFVVWNDEVEGRLDCFFYQPIFVELEKKIKKLTSKTLGDYIINISGGATPEKDEPEKYYSELSENGVPFLRVQNVTEEGVSLEDCKYINFDTHHGMLKRSQVKKGYLITKITGVGRMAVSSVAPNGFDGNINQHLVAIKTVSYQTSEVLAAFLNSNIGERLAFRRSTGGTRPALDYQALKTIPIVFKPEIVESMQSAYSQKKEKEAEAQRLLDSIDGYVLDEIGIKLPKIEGKMSFVVWSDKVAGRIDPYYYMSEVNIIKQRLSKIYGTHYLAEIIEDIYRYPTFYGFEYQKSGVPVIKGENIEKSGMIDPTQNFDCITNEIHQQFFKTHLREGDLLFTVRGIIGKIGLFDGFVPEANINANVIKIRISNEHNPSFYWAILNSNVGQKIIQNLVSGQVQKTITVPDIKNIQIPIPPLEIQNKIAKEVKRRISEAERLKAEASKIIEKAKKKVEEMILGD